MVQVLIGAAVVLAVALVLLAITRPRLVRYYRRRPGERWQGQRRAWMRGRRRYGQPPPEDDPGF